MYSYPDILLYRYIIFQHENVINFPKVYELHKTKVTKGIIFLAIISNEDLPLLIKFSCFFLYFQKPTIPWTILFGTRKVLLVSVHFFKYLFLAPLQKYSLGFSLEIYEYCCMAKRRKVLPSCMQSEMKFKQKKNIL